MNESRATLRSPTGAVMTAMLIASVALGIVYNSASPLGVRGKSAARGNPEAGVQANHAAPLAPAHTRTGYYNQTLAMTLSPAEPARSALSPPAATKTFPELMWPQVKALLGQPGTVLIDARTAANFQAEHIAGAVSLPSTSSHEEVAAFVARHGKNTPFIIYCGSATCRMSHTLANELAEHGCTSVKIMPGGYSEYRAAAAKEAGAK